MAHNSQVLLHVSLVLVLLQRSECSIFSYLMSMNQPPAYYSGGYVDSFASAVPGSSQNSISPVERGVSSFGPPPVPQVLRNAINPPAAAARPEPSPNAMVNMFTGQGMGSPAMSPVSPVQPRVNKGYNPGGMSRLPLTGNVKKLVNKWANQLGHKAWYEAHGCVDPTTTLHGKQGQMAMLAMMMGCNNREAKRACDLAQLVHGGKQGARTRMMMDMFMSKETKNTFEKCLTPSTLMAGFTGMMGSSPNPYGSLTPPPGAAGYSSSVDCSAISSMLMMGGGEGMMSGEQMESIGRMRNKYMKMECQENLLMGSLPYRMCCPGKVPAPTLQEAMMVKNMGGA